MKYRVDELANRCAVSVDTVRFYQARGLLPPPTREGRAAWYSGEHLERLKRIRELKEKGLTLVTIQHLLAGRLNAADQALVAELIAPMPDEEASSDLEESLTPEEFSKRTGVPLALLQAVEAEGLLVPGIHRGEPRYSGSDLAAAQAGLALLEAGIPLNELLALAREYDRAARRTSERAVGLFERYIRDQIRATAPSDEEAADRLVQVFRKLLPATTTLVAHHFRRVLLATAQRQIEERVAEDEPPRGAEGAETGFMGPLEIAGR
ncbi:MAG: MerR family transcriptional regulator [Actinomycetota bacterium]